MSLVFKELGELVDFKGGGTPSRNVEEYWDNSIPWATVKDLNEGITLTQTQEFISELGLKNSASNLITKGTIIIPTRMALGKVVISEIDVAINQDLKAVSVKDKEKLDVKYLLRFLESYKENIASMGKGATVKGITLDQLKAIKVPLPPLAAQRRIASILDQADELRQKRQQAIEKLDQLLQATFIDMFGDPVSNSKKWTEKTLGEVVVFNTGKLDSNAAEENGIYPFFTCSRTPFAINTYAFDIEALLLAGNNAAGQYWVKHYKGKFNAYQRTYVLTIKDSLCTYGYLRYVLQFLLGFLQRMSKGSSTKYLTLSILKPIKIPIPPLDLQRKFIQFYENIDSQNQLLMRNEIEFSKLFFTLQNQAFNGTL
ncbi:restriction endonuclease subunit S [Acinetobacter johnsonii]|uniref:Type I restriction modification DNA specificity domain protein n=1 Tax=Acinetobacter johnsonii SH046 TaxID=575586 RepID=D0SGH3_ACIJO|nr:restriction endonuclease subunit S [Acinetobacter johnsonii]EEY94931.1 type I restriction modification DNA specificity domain protein [Acinetobacter johnsonii SH046]